METLVGNASLNIDSSPAGGTLGRVVEETHEAMLVYEARRDSAA